MSLMSVGDLAQSLSMRRHNASLKSDLQTLAQEMTTGRVSDVAKQTRGDYAPLSAIDASLARLQAYGAATSEAGLMANAMQVTLGTLSSLTTDLYPKLISTATSGQSASIDTLGRTAHNAFETAVSALNTSVGGRSLFAGTSSDRPALADADTIFSALDVAISGAVSAGDIEVALDTWFASPTGFATVGYLGDTPLSGIPIADGDQARLGVTAADPALIDTLKGLAMAALLDRGALAGSAAGRSDLAQRAGQVLANGTTGRVTLAAGVGLVQAQIDAAQTRNSAESMALQIARAGIVAADPYETATKLEATQTQLETLYSITARLSRLSLTDFLR